MANATGNKTKCSKKNGEFCRIHNPAPLTSTPSTSAKETFLSEFGVNLAAQVTPPNTGENMQQEYFELKARHEADPGNMEVHDDFYDLQRNFGSTLTGNNILREKVLAARQALYDHAATKNIDIPDINLYVYGDSYAGVEPDPEIVALDKEYNETMYDYEDASETRETILRAYLSNIVAKEFPDSKHASIAHFAALNRYSHMEYEDTPEQMEKTYNGYGFTRQAFFEGIVNDSNWTRKIRNIEEAYLTAATGKKPTKKVLDGFAKERELRAKQEPTTEDTERAAENAMTAVFS